MVTIHSEPGRNEEGMRTKRHKETFHTAIHHAALFSFLSLFHSLFLLAHSIACFKSPAAAAAAGPWTLTVTINVLSQILQLIYF